MREEQTNAAMPRWAIVAMALAIAGIIAPTVVVAGRQQAPATEAPDPATPVEIADYPSTVRQPTVALRGSADPGAEIEITAMDTSTAISDADGRWEARTRLHLGENEILVGEPSGALQTIYVTRKRSAAERANLERVRAKRREEEAANRAAAKRRLDELCASEPARCMSDKEVTEACLAGTLNDYEACVKSSYRYHSELYEDAAAGK